MSEINVAFLSLPRPSIDSLFNRAANLKRKFIRWSEEVKQFCPKYVCQKRATLFDNLDSFAKDNTKEQTFVEILALLDFQSIRVKKNLKATDTTQVFLENIISSRMSDSSNLVENPFFFCKHYS